MATLIKVDQLHNGVYINTVYGDSMYHVTSCGCSWYRLELNKMLVATFSDGSAQEHQYSMLKVAADYTFGGTTVKHYAWNIVEKEC